MPSPRLEPRTPVLGGLSPVRLRLLAGMAALWFPAAGVSQSADWSLSRDGRELTIRGRVYPIETGEILPEPGTRYYIAGRGVYMGGVYAVHIPGAYPRRAPLPLIVDSHGLRGNGAATIEGWIRHAEQHGWIVVTPSFGTASMAGDIGTDARVLTEIMQSVFSSLQIDRRHVLGTGFSGGGLPIWNLMMRQADWFTALCFRAANFHGGMASPAPFRDRPVFVFWGEFDEPQIFQRPWAGEGPQGLDVWLSVKRMRGEFRRRPDPNVFVSEEAGLRWEMIPGGGHDSRPDLAAQWFAREVIGAPGPESGRAAP